MRHRAAAHATRAGAHPKRSPPPAALHPLDARPPSPSVQRGDIVEVVANSAYQKGMPHKWYHGRTGIIYNVTKRAVGVEVNKQVRALQAGERGAAGGSERTQAGGCGRAWRDAVAEDTGCWVCSEAMAA